jgi:3-oxoacyl-[acyl-carrier protein] reductase
MSKPFVAVVTGSSSGIGQAIAVEFAQRHAHVMLHAKSNLAGIAQTVDSIRSRDSNASMRTILADITSHESVKAMVNAAFRWHGHIDVWVNAAGADVLTGTAKQWSFADKLQQLWSVDVAGTLLISRLVAEHMISNPCAKNRIPSIVNIGWDQASEGMEGDSGQYFSAVKSAVAAFSKSLAKSVGPRIRVNCIAPGWIQTEWGHSSPPAWHERAIGESSLNRWGTPMDVARAVAILSMGDCDFINGQTIAVNGGWQPMSLSVRSNTSRD